MRIIGGIYRNRVIKRVPVVTTRETSGKVRGAIFNSILKDLKGTVLDLFTGSGAMGIEAISRGADKAILVDNNPEAIKTAACNIKTLKISEVQIIKNDYIEALKYFNRKKIKFDCIFLDPPYKLLVINDILDYIKKNNMLNKQGIIVCEYSADVNLEFTDFSLKKETKYGIKKITIYRSD